MTGKLINLIFLSSGFSITLLLDLHRLATETHSVVILNLKLNSTYKGALLVQTGYIGFILQAKKKTHTFSCIVLEMT